VLSRHSNTALQVVPVVHLVLESLMVAIMNLVLTLEPHCALFRRLIMILRTRPTLMKY